MGPDLENLQIRSLLIYASIVLVGKEQCAKSKIVTNGDITGCHKSDGMIRFCYISKVHQAFFHILCHFSANNSYIIQIIPFSLFSSLLMQLQNSYLFNSCSYNFFLCQLLSLPTSSFSKLFSLQLLRLTTRVERNQTFILDVTSDGHKLAKI